MPAVDNKTKCNAVNSVMNSNNNSFNAATNFTTSNVFHSASTQMNCKHLFDASTKNTRPQQQQEM